MLKKSASILMAAMIGFGAMAGQAEAKSSFINDLLDALIPPSSSSAETRPSSNGDPMAKRVNLPLDGTYSSVYFPNGAFQHNLGHDAVVAEHHFELDKPAEVDLHFIGHTDRFFNHYVYDSDSNQLGWHSQNTDNATDRNVVLAPGHYVIKTTIGWDTKKNVDFEIKGVKHDIYPTVTKAGYRRHDANILYYNVETVDYFPHATPNEPDTKYYKFVLQSSIDMKFMFDRLSKKCNVSIYLLDEDESEIETWYGLDDTHMEKIKYLNAGTYYLKVKRNNDDGGVYSIRIK